MHPPTAAFAAASPLPRARPLTGTSQHRLCPLRASLSPSRTRAPAPPIRATEPTPPAEPVPALHPLLAAANRATVDGMCAAVDAVYGGEGMAWRRFYTLEVLARIPFFAYTCLLHLRETLGGPSDAATRRLRAHFEQADNEALHLAVMCVAGRPRWLDRFLASHLGLAYFLVSVCVFLASPAVAFNFNELIEIHAYDTYDKYIRENEDALRTVDAVPLIAKEYYEAEEPARVINSMYDVLVAIRDDERHHSEQLNQFGVEALSERASM